MLAILAQPRRANQRHLFVGYESSGPRNGWRENISGIGETACTDSGSAFRNNPFSRHGFAQRRSRNSGYPRAQDVESAKSASFGEAAASAADADAALLAVEQQFNAISAELLALEQLSRDTGRHRSAERPPEPVPFEAYAQKLDQDKVGTGRIETILTRLDPIERAITATPACTIAGLGVNTLRE
jgi:hypothetical protein